MMENDFISCTNSNRIYLLIIFFVPANQKANWSFSCMLHQFRDRLGDKMHGWDFPCFFSLFRWNISSADSQFLNNTVHFQTGKQLKGFLFLHRLWDKIRKGEFNWNIAVNSSQCFT